MMIVCNEPVTMYRWTGDGRYTPPTRDNVQDMKNATVTYDNGTLTLTFQRLRNTTDHMDWKFTESDCYYFIFPVGGGPHTDTGISKHTNTPIVSSRKICIGNSAVYFFRINQRRSRNVLCKIIVVLKVVIVILL